MRSTGAPRTGSRIWLLCLGLVWVGSAVAEAQAGAEAEIVSPPSLADAALIQEVLDRGVVLVDGAPVDRDGNRSTIALVVFQQPLPKTYRLLTQPDRQGEYRPDIDSIERISMKPEGPLDEHRMSIMFMQIAYRLQYRFDPRLRHIHWELDPDFENAVERVSGSWELQGLDEARTLARFRTSVRVGKGLPTWIEEGVTRRNIPETLEHCRQWIDSGGRWRP